MNPKPDKIIPALYGGIVMAIISTVPFLSIINCLCCAGVLLGGFLGVFFYKNNFTPSTPPFTSGDCLTVGALSGVFGAMIGTALHAVFLALFGNIAAELVVDMIRNMNLEIPQEAWDAIEQSMNEGLTVFSLISTLFVDLILFSVFGLLGGLIGYNVYKPKGPAVMPPPPMQPTQPM